MMHKSLCDKEEVYCCFSIQFQFNDGFETMLKAWRSMEEVPYCLSRLSINFQGYMNQKIYDLNPFLSKITRLVAAIKSIRFIYVIYTKRNKKYYDVLTDPTQRYVKLWCFGCDVIMMPLWRLAGDTWQIALFLIIVINVSPWIDVVDDFHSYSSRRTDLTL